MCLFSQVSGLRLDDEFNSKKTMSLPSSPHAYRSQGSGRRGPSDFAVKDTWNKVVKSTTLQNQPLLPYQEWDIDFSELTVGTRVGIGKLLLRFIFNYLRHCCVMNHLSYVLRM